MGADHFRYFSQGITFFFPFSKCAYGKEGKEACEFGLSSAFVVAFKPVH